MERAFYRDLGAGRYLAAEHTAGPWSSETQHLGPPSALLTRELERCAPAPDTLLARITVEVLGPVPVGELRVSAQVDRPGRSVQLLSASLESAERPVARAVAWRIARGDTADQAAGAAEPLAPVSAGVEFGRPEGWGGGYIDAMEWRSLKGALADPGPATVWVRQRIPLVAGEAPTPLQRLMAVADSGSGVSNLLDPRQWLFINTEVTTHVQREPVGEWIGLDSTTVLGPDGVGTAVSVLHDQHGQAGNCNQALLVRPR
ncbi:TesB-like acyl-CoA thioesterase 5 [Streptomonospora alba]|uniref:TesB-like acyl-CoA thioesterase 5 n=1 Tax=Streptomonospora alba TaxID=183763 RepID=A0A0C2FET0_9ACTN|nr:thioesterase family protein [Streptomonospora alba]KIH97689.1 TesB-like acyl-CoA thioesterase 5 [Streptomonospora alba]